MSTGTAHGSDRRLHGLTPIRGGTAYSTRGDLARLADGMETIDDRLMTIVAATRHGGYLVDNDVGGADFCDARELGEMLPRLRGTGTDVRLWLDWPSGPAEQTQLRASLRDLAMIIGAVVWVPPAGGRCEVEPASGDLCALDGTGAIAAWAATVPIAGAPLRYTSDPDGRLMPADGFLTAHFPGVPLVSVPESQLWSMTSTYTRVRDLAGVFPIDVMVTPAGKLAACRSDGTPFPLGPHHLAQILSTHGWRGEEIVLLADVPEPQRTGLRRYLDHVARSLGRRLPLVADGSLGLAGWPRLAPEMPMAGPRPSEATGVARPNRSAVHAAARDVETKAPAARSAAEAMSRLTAVVAHIAAQLPDLQRRCRVLAAGSSAVADALLDDWYSLCLRLVEARYATPGQSMWAGRAPNVAEDFDTARCVSDLERAHTVLLDSMRMAGSCASTVDGRATGTRVASANSWVPIVDARWHWHVWPTIALALANLDGAASLDARQMLQLTDAVAAYVGPQAAAGTDDDIRMLLERLVIRPEPAPDGVTVAGSSGSLAAASTSTDPDDLFGPDPTRSGEWTPAAVFLARPRLSEARRTGTPHGLAWLRVHPQVNEEQFDLYVASLWPPARAATDGIPSDRLFLVGHLDPPTSASYVVQVRVGPHGAIDLPASGGRPPAELSGLLDSPDAYVLPAAWLDRTEIVLYDGDGDDRTMTTVPTRLHLLEAPHGLKGHPGGIITWRRRGRIAGTAYAMLNESGQLDADWLRLYRLRPPARRGRLVRLRVGRGAAVDVRRTAARIAALPFVRSSLPDLQAESVDAVLPREAFPRVIVTGSFVAEDGRWRDAAAGPLGRWANLDFFLHAMSSALSQAG